MRVYLFIVTVSFLGSMLSACYHENTTMATIIVKNANGEFVENAQVRIFAEPTSQNSFESIVDITKLSNSRGEAYFNLSNIYEPGQNGVGVFAVTCEKLNLSGSGIVEIVQEQNNIIEIIIN